MRVSYGKTILFLSAVTFVPSVMADDDDDERAICQGNANPILSVADFDGNGIVNRDDLVLIKKAKEKEVYFAFYDINVDGEIDKNDVYRAESDLGKFSTALDQQLAKLFHYTKQYQLVDSTAEAKAMDYFKTAEALAGHGEHWDSASPYIETSPVAPSGLNIAADDQRVLGMYWGIDAVPVFENAANDYPQPGGDWMDSRVIAFDGHPPKFTVSPDEKWHTHAGLCITVEMGQTEPKVVLNQHTTFNQCQSIPSLVKTGGDHNLWVNIWMLHGWMFDLNPNGFFANTHPCADPDAPAEETINGGREVPPFFQHQHG